MAYVNVASWTSDQVAEWTKGLSDHEAMQSYARQLQAAGITGGRLLQLRPGELRQLGISRVGHQEVILAAVSRLQTLHFTLNSENLQQLAMRLCSKTRCLYNELSRQSVPSAPGVRQRVTVPILEAVTDTMTSVKDIIGWLNTAPFDGQDEFTEIKSRILDPSIELVINAQRDSFAVRPVDGIREASKQLSDVCDSVIQDCSDSLSLLPAPLLIMTIKRKPDEPLGLHIVRAISGVPIITGVKFQSPAHLCGKLEEGDEIVQVNYQTVVGWQLGKVIDLLQDKESGAEVYLTVKKRPRHSNLIDQVYFKPFRLPNKRRTPYRWNSSPRPDLLTSLPKITLPPKLSSPVTSVAELTPQQSSDSDSETFLAGPGSAADSPASVRHYLPKPRPSLQRRATVTGASPTCRRPPAALDQLWELRREGRGRPASRSPSPARPATCIGDHLSLQARAPTPLWAPGGGPEPEPEPDPGSPPPPRCSVSSLPEPPAPADKPRLEKTQSAPAYDVGRREESFERALRELPRRAAIEEEEDSDAASEWDAGSTTTNGEVASAAGRRPEVPVKPALDTGLPAGEAAPEAAGHTPSPPDRPRSPLGTSQAEPSPADTEYEDKPKPEWEPEAEPAAADGPVTEPGLRAGTGQERTQRLEDEGGPAAHPTVLLLSGVTQGESSSDMPAALKDASPLREIIEKMDVAFRGLKTSLSDLSPAPRSPDGSPPSLLRQNARLSFKGRRVSCKDLGQGDCQGWLHLKKEGRGFLHGDKWAKRWLVLHGHKLYGYKDKESEEAETLIALPGYQVSPAADVRSKRHAFRVHNNERSVVFASDSQLDMTKWMNKMGLSAIAYDSSKAFRTGGFCRPDRDGNHIEDTYFSDTDEEDNKGRTPLKRPPVQRGSRQGGVTPSPSSSLDRARQRLRSWRSGSPAPSVGSLSSLSSLGSERPAVRKKPSLRFLARVRRDTEQSACSAAPADGQRRASEPETAHTHREAVTLQHSAPVSEGVCPEGRPAAESCAGRPLAPPPDSGSSQRRPVPPPRRPRPRQPPPSYVNWRVPERRRLSAQGRGVTPEGQLVASLLSGTHTVPRRTGSADPERPELPGYMRPTISSRAARQAEQRRPPLAKQRSLSTSGLCAVPPGQVGSLAGGKRRASVASEQPAAAVCETGRRPTPCRYRGHARTASDGAPELPRKRPEPRPEPAGTAAIPEEAGTGGPPSGPAAACGGPGAAESGPRATVSGRQPPEERPPAPGTPHGTPAGPRAPPGAHTRPLAPHGTHTHHPASPAAPARPPDIAARQLSPPNIATRPLPAPDIATRPLSPSSIAARPLSPSSIATRPLSPSSIAARPLSPSSIAARPLSPSIATRPPSPSSIATRPLLAPDIATRPLSPAGTGRRLKKSCQYECPSWSRPAEEARMRLAFELDLSGGAGEVSELPALEEPLTPRKPAMGVSMIGKQRRTPTSTSSSPHFVFPSSPLSPPPGVSPIPGAGAETTGISRGIAHAASPPVPLSKSQTSPALGWGLRVLPKYGLQYPPVFTPDTYSLEQMSGAAAPAHLPADRNFAHSATQTETAQAPATALVSEVGSTPASPPGETGPGERTLRRRNTLKGRRRRGSLRTEGMLTMLALQRAVKAKQAEVASISELLRTPVTRARLARWLADNQGLLEAAGQQLTG